MSKTDYIIGFSSTKFSHGILTTRAAVMFGSLIQKRKGKLNYISFLVKSSLYKLYLKYNLCGKAHIIMSVAKMYNIISYPIISHPPRNTYLRHITKNV